MTLPVPHSTRSTYDLHQHPSMAQGSGVAKPGEEIFYASNLMPRPRLSRRRRRLVPGYIPRPANSFILFRKDAVERLKSEDTDSSESGKRRRQAEISKEISRQWKALSREERAKWDRKAAEIKTEHEREFPNYSYRPDRRPRTVAYPRVQNGGNPTPSTSLSPNDLLSSPPSLSSPLPAYRDPHELAYASPVSYGKSWIPPSPVALSPKAQFSYEADDLKVRYTDNLCEDRWYMGDHEVSPDYNETSLTPITPAIITPPNTHQTLDFGSPPTEVQSWPDTYGHPIPTSSDMSLSGYKEEETYLAHQVPYANQFTQATPTSPLQAESINYLSAAGGQCFDNQIVAPRSAPSFRCPPRRPDCLECSVPTIYNAPQDDRPTSSSSGSEWSSDSGISHDEWMNMVEGLQIDLPQEFKTNTKTIAAAPQESPIANYAVFNGQTSTMSPSHTHW